MRSNREALEAALALAGIAANWRIDSITNPRPVLNYPEEPDQDRLQKDVVEAECAYATAAVEEMKELPTCCALMVKALLDPQRARALYLQLAEHGTDVLMPTTVDVAMAAQAEVQMSPTTATLSPTAELLEASGLPYAMGTVLEKDPSAESWVNSFLDSAPSTTTFVQLETESIEAFCSRIAHVLRLLEQILSAFKKVMLGNAVLHGLLEQMGSQQ